VFLHGAGAERDHRDAFDAEAEVGVLDAFAGGAEEGPEVGRIMRRGTEADEEIDGRGIDTVEAEAEEAGAEGAVHEQFAERGKRGADGEHDGFVVGGGAAERKRGAQGLGHGDGHEGVHGVAEGLIKVEEQLGAEADGE